MERLAIQVGPSLIRERGEFRTVSADTVVRTGLGIKSAPDEYPGKEALRDLIHRKHLAPGWCGAPYRLGSSLVAITRYGNEARDTNELATLIGARN